METRYADGEIGCLSAKSDTRIVGSGIGLLAAAAVASSPSLSSLVPIAVDVVLLSYRIGSGVDATATRLDLTLSADDCWATLVTGQSENVVRDLLLSFHKEKVIPSISQLMSLTD